MTMFVKIPISRCYTIHKKGLCDKDYSPCPPPVHAVLMSTNSNGARINPKTGLNTKNYQVGPSATHATPVE